MAAEPTLYARMELRLNDFEKKLARATKSADATMDKIERRGNQMTARLANVGAGAFGGFAKGAILAVAPVLSLSAALNGTRAALDKFGDIADRAAESGLDAEYFQGVAYSAKLAGVEFDTFSAALATFAKNSGLAAEGKGKMVSALQALNPELLRSIQNATTQEERLRLAADALNATTDAAQRAALASALFGESGIVLAKAFDGGAAALDAMVLKAKDLGLVVDREVIARAEELGDKLDTAAQVVDLKLKVALMDLAPLMSDAAGWAAEFARLMAIAYEQTKAIEDRQFLRPLQNELANTYNAMEPVKDRIAEIEAALAGGAPNGMILKLDLSEAQAKLTALEEQANRLLTRITTLQGAPAPGAPSVTTPAVPPTSPSPNFMGGADLGVLDLNVPDPGVVAEVATNFGSVRAAAEASTVAISTTAGAVSELERQFEVAESMASSFASTLIDGALDGKDAATILSDAFGQLSRQLLQMAADQAIKSLFSGLLGVFGGGGGAAVSAGQNLFGFADGGIAKNGRPVPLRRFARGGVSKTAAIFGEAGAEAAVPLPDGRSIPVNLRLQAPPGPVSSTTSAQAIHVTVGVSADSVGNLTPFVESVSQKTVGRAAPAIVATSVQQANKSAPGAMATFQRNQQGSDYRT